MITTQTFQCHGCDSKIQNAEKLRCKIQIPFDDPFGYIGEGNPRLVNGMGCVVFRDIPAMKADWKLISETTEK